MKQDAVRLYHKLREREERKAVLLEEERTRSTPAQEREQLLQKVKEDNAEMAAMERQITQINEQMKKKKEELELIEQVSRNTKVKIYALPVCRSYHKPFPINRKNRAKGVLV